MKEPSKRWIVIQYLIPTAVLQSNNADNPMVGKMILFCFIPSFHLMRTSFVVMVLGLIWSRSHRHPHLPIIRSGSGTGVMCPNDHCQHQGPKWDNMTCKNCVVQKKRKAQIKWQFWSLTGSFALQLLRRATCNHFIPY